MKADTHGEFHGDIAEYAPALERPVKHDRKRFERVAKLLAALALTTAAVAAAVSVRVSVRSVSAHGASVEVGVSIMSAGDAGELGYELYELGTDGWGAGEPLQSGAVDSRGQELELEGLKSGASYRLDITRAVAGQSERETLASRVFKTKSAGA